MKCVRKGLSIAISVCFFGSSTGITEAVREVARPQPKPPHLQLALPSDLGQITDFYTPQNQNPQIILIQDLHAHYGVQKNIAGILDGLSSKLQSAGSRTKQFPGALSLEPRASLPFALAIEGASGPVDTSIMALFPDRKIKQAAADYLMREGVLSGAEYFSGMRGLSKVLNGVEDRTAYMLHRELFRKTFSERDQFVRLLRGLQVDIAALRERTWKGDLKAFQKKWNALERGEMDLADAIDWLSQTALPLGIDVSGLQHIKEGDQAYDRIAAVAFLLKSQLATTPAEKDLVQVDHDLSLLLRVADLQATEQEVRTFAPRMNQFVALATTMTSSRDELKSSHPLIPSSSLRRVISSSIDYYALAMARNEPMVENTLKLLNRVETRGRGDAAKQQFPRVSQSPRPRVAVLVAGGFHTAPITQILKQKKIPYLVITPHMEHVSDHDHDLYVKRLRGDLLTVPEVMAASPVLVANSKRLSSRLDKSTLAIGITLTGMVVVASLLSASGLSPDSFQAHFWPWANDPQVSAALHKLQLLMGIGVVGMTWRGRNLSNRIKGDDPGIFASDDQADYPTQTGIGRLSDQGVQERADSVNFLAQERRINDIFPDESLVDDLFKAARFAIQVRHDTRRSDPARLSIAEDAFRIAADRLQLRKPFAEKLIKEVGRYQLNEIGYVLTSELRSAAARTSFVDQVRLLGMQLNSTDLFAVSIPYRTSLENAIRSSGNKIQLTQEEVEQFLRAAQGGDKSIAQAIFDTKLDLSVNPKDATQILDELDRLQGTRGTASGGGRGGALSRLVSFAGWSILTLGGMWLMNHYGGEAGVLAAALPMFALPRPSLELSLFDPILDLYLENAVKARKKGIKFPEGEVERNMNHVVRAYDKAKYAAMQFNETLSDSEKMTFEEFEDLRQAMAYHDLGKWNSEDSELFKVLYAPIAYDRDSPEFASIKKVLERHEEYVFMLAEKGGLPIRPSVRAILQFMSTGRSDSPRSALIGAFALGGDVYDAMTDPTRGYHVQQLRSDIRLLPTILSKEFLNKLGQSDPHHVVPFFDQLYRKNVHFQSLMEVSILQKVEQTYTQAAKEILESGLSGLQVKSLLRTLRHQFVSFNALSALYTSPGLWPEVLQGKGFSDRGTSTMHSVAVWGVLLLPFSGLSQFHQLLLGVLAVGASLATFFVSSSPAHSHEQKTSNKPTVVLVEDDEAFREMARFILEEDYAVKAFTNGHDALSYLQSGASVDALVTDLQMPLMDGGELISKVKAIGRRLPTILLTSHTGEMRQNVIDQHREVVAWGKDADLMSLGNEIRKLLPNPSANVVHNDAKNLLKHGRVWQAIQGMAGILLNAVLSPFIQGRLEQELKDIAVKVNAYLAAQGKPAVELRPLKGSLWKRLTVFGTHKKGIAEINLWSPGDLKLRTLVHEVLGHELHPNSSETEVIDITDKIVEELKDQQQALPSAVSRWVRVMRAARLKVNPAEFVSMLPNLLQTLNIQPKEAKSLTSRVQTARRYLTQA